MKITTRSPGLLSEETIREIAIELIDLRERVAALEIEAEERAEMVRIAEEKKQSNYLQLQMMQAQAAQQMKNVDLYSKYAQQAIQNPTMGSGLIGGGVGDWRTGKIS